MDIRSAPFMRGQSNRRGFLGDAARGTALLGLMGLGSMPERLAGEEASPDRPPDHVATFKGPNGVRYYIAVAQSHGNDVGSIRLHGRRHLIYKFSVGDKKEINVDTNADGTLDTKVEKGGFFTLKHGEGQSTLLEYKGYR